MQDTRHGFGSATVCAVRLSSLPLGSVVNQMYTQFLPVRVALSIRACTFASRLHVSQLPSADRDSSRFCGASLEKGRSYGGKSVSQRAAQVVGEPNPCSALPSTVRHSHLWESLGYHEFFGRRLQTSMTRATVEDSTAGLGQTLRTGTSSGWWAILPWRLGSEHEFTGTWAAGRNSGSGHEKAGRCRPSRSLVTGQLLVIHTP